jgi:hypothetical protein
VIAVVCWKWRRIPTGHQLPHVCDYTPDHVHTLQRMVARHTTVPHRFLCVTDDPCGLECETLPLWDTLEAGGCYHRLRMFDPDFDAFGERWTSIDLDCVVTGNIDHLLRPDADFAIHRYAYGGRPLQHYNGGLITMTRGARPQVWEQFHAQESTALMRRRNDLGVLIGSDQAWISHVLGPGERTFGPSDGVHEMLGLQRRQNRTVQDPMRLHWDTRLVMWSGPRDPSQSDLPWVKEHYR